MILWKGPLGPSCLPAFRLIGAALGSPHLVDQRQVMHQGAADLALSYIITEALQERIFVLKKDLGY